MDLDRADVSVVEPHLDGGDVVRDDAHPGHDRRLGPEELDRGGQLLACFDPGVHPAAPERVVSTEHEHEFGTDRAVVPPVRVRAGRGDRRLNPPGNTIDGAPRDELWRSGVDEVRFESLVDNTG